MTVIDGRLKRLRKNVSQLQDFLAIHRSSPFWFGMAVAAPPSYEQQSSLARRLIHRFCAGSAQPASPTPAPARRRRSSCGGTGCSTTEPAATFEQRADLDIAEDLGAGADQHAVADLRMAVAALLAGAAERHVLEDRDVVLDHRGLADDEAGGMVEEDAAAHRHGRIDVGLEDLRRAALQIEREVAAPLLARANAPDDGSGWRGSP